VTVAFDPDAITAQAAPLEKDSAMEPPLEKKLRSWVPLPDDAIPDHVRFPPVTCCVHVCPLSVLVMT
jgi:hypothetical protein